MMPSNKQQTIAFFISALASHPHIDPPLPAPCSPASHPLPPLVLLDSRLPVPLHWEKRTDSVHGQISVHIFAPNRRYCFYYPLSILQHAQKKMFTNGLLFAANNEIGVVRGM